MIRWRVVRMGCRVRTRRKGVREVEGLGIREVGRLEEIYQNVERLMDKVGSQY